MALVKGYDMGTTVVLDLPSELVERAEYLAHLTQRDVGSLLADRLAFLLPPLNTLPPPTDYLPVSDLSDSEVLALAASQIGLVQNARMRHLQEKRESQSLSVAEQVELLSLWQVYEIGSLRKAESLAEAVRRGLRPSLHP
jgi:hypothetical protein